MMKLRKQIDRGIQFMRNQDIEIRIRMLFFLEYAALFAGIIGTIAMLAFAVSPIVLVPNFILILFCVIGIYFTHNGKKYQLASALIVVGCAYIALPVMFFTAGGNKSGMPIWFLFGIVFICMMLKGNLRVIMSGIGILIFLVCMIVGYHYPQIIIPLKNEQMVFMDMVQSFALVSVIICVCLLIYIASYDRQREILEKQSVELKKAMNTDALTEISNRHAYYDATHRYMEEGYQENLVLIAMDVNGLKSVNDSKGHAAGDALIKEAADIMQDAYGKYGEVFRTGGDEFIAVLNCDDQMASKLYGTLETVIRYTNEKRESDVSIAAGIAVWNENRDKNFFELEKLADTIMYRNKSNYYRESGIDRRKR